MYKHLVGAVVTLSLSTVSVQSAEEGPCKYEFKQEFYVTIAMDIAEHSLEKHSDHFKSNADRDSTNELTEKTKVLKFPWNLPNEIELGQFIEDIMNKNTVASRDPQVKLDVLSKKLADGRMAWLEKNTGTFVVFNPVQALCGTAFRENFQKEKYDKET